MFGLMKQPHEVSVANHLTEEEMGIYNLLVP